MARLSSPLGIITVRKYLKGNVLYMMLPEAVSVVLDLKVDDQLTYFPLKGGGFGIMKGTDAVQKLDPDASVELLEKYAKAKRKRKGFDETYETVMDRKLRHEREVEELINRGRTPQQRQMIQEQRLRDKSVIGETRRNVKWMIKYNEERKRLREETKGFEAKRKEIEAAMKLREQQRKRLKGEDVDEDEGEQDD